MALLKELYSVKETQISESSVPYGIKKSFETLETNMERVGAQLKADSQLARALAKVNGDTKHFASIVKKFDALYEEVLDLIQYTSMSFDPQEEE